MSIGDIDFGRLYRDHYAAANRNPKPASVWDSRAADMAHKPHKSRYDEEFIGRMDLAGAETLLDIGCGPGTICLPLASRFQRVVGLDFSQRMLDIMLADAATRGHDNVEALHLAWEDDWSAVPVCDIVVASRSIMVADIEAALHKLHDKARRRVYLTHLVDGHFIDPGVMDVIGRDMPTLPDYIYIVNILHGMGVHVRVDYIEHEGRLASVTDVDELIRRVAWNLGALSDDEHTRLHTWYQHLAPISRTAWAPTRWAFISWGKT